MGFLKLAGSLTHFDTNFSFADAPISWKGKGNKVVSLSAAAHVAVLYISFRNTDFDPSIASIALI